LIFWEGVADERMVTGRCLRGEAEWDRGGRKVMGHKRAK